MDAKTKTRMTPQRQLILDQVREAGRHASADEVFQMVRRRLPHISLGTVYRNLEMLTRQGLVKQLGTAGSQRRYEGNLTPHYHLRCESCDRVVDVPYFPLPGLEAVRTGFQDYEITGYELEFLGICPSCRALNDGPV
ncbi:MAG: transcriptional repressor [Thermodesulfobacteriota bacterium]